MKDHRVIIGIGDAAAAQLLGRAGDGLGTGGIGQGVDLAGLADIPVLAELAGQVAAGGAEREHRGARQEVVERLFLDRIDAVTAGSAIRGEDYLAAEIGADKTESPLPLVQFADCLLYTSDAADE